MSGAARKFSHHAMDTEFSVYFGTGVDESFAESAAAAAFERIDNLELTLSRFNDSSDVAMMRGLRPGEIGTVAPETMTALVVAANVCAATGGAFDPTLGPAMDLFRASGGWGNIAAEDLEDAFAKCGMQRLVLDPENMRVSVKPDRLGRATALELDFGGIGKGLALDECRKLLESEQFEISSCLLDAGTSTQLAWGEPWPIGVGGKWKARTRLDTVLMLNGAALSGSGAELQGEHVIDARRGVAASAWAQCWVTAPSAAVADALSTAALAMNGGEIAGACAALDARVLVARNQASVLDRFRAPLRWFP